MTRKEATEISSSISQQRQIINDNAYKAFALMEINPRAAMDAMRATTQACLKLMVEYDKILPLIEKGVAEDNAYES
jgi:hypothetical protein